MASMNIDYKPSYITPGTKVALNIDPLATYGTYKYTWRVNGQPMNVPSAPAIEWTPAQPGKYDFEVEALLDPASVPKGQTPPPSQGVWEETLHVMQTLVSEQFVHDFVVGNDGKGGIKQNFDAKMEGLTTGVGKVASAVDNLTDKLPDPGQPTRIALQQHNILDPQLRTLAAFFAAIRNRTEAIRFPAYNEFINRLLCRGIDFGEATCRTEEPFGSPPISPPFGSPPIGPSASSYGAPSIGERRDELEARPSIYGVDAYNLLKLATEAFLIFEAGIAIRPPKEGQTGQFGSRTDTGVFVPANDTDDVLGEASRLGEPVTFLAVSQRLEQYLRSGTTGTTYLRRIVDALLGVDPQRREQRLPYCDGILRRRFSCPSLLELIWSYWHEEGGLVQTLNAITLRFQNRRGASDKDPLAHLEIDPLRPLNNLLWGYVQDEMHRLTLPRRAYEYDHHYGLTIYGKAVPSLRPADSRSKFLEGFHNLLYRTSIFYHEDSDTTVIADAFPLLNALREVHLLLAEGAHNQFGDLPWTARVEMLIQQWLLSRPEMREFLRGRAMVPYAESWMGQVDTMKRLQGWSEVNVTNFYELGVFGEQILLSIRYHDWSAVNDQNEAKLWARYWKPEIQRYIHSYRAVSGVDLTTEPVDATAPWVHLRKRQAEEQRRRAGRS